MKNYKDWLIDEYFDEESIEGDLARDVAGDNTFPTTNALSPLLFHLSSRNACKEAKIALLDTWAIFSKAGIDERIKNYKKDL